MRRLWTLMIILSMILGLFTAAIGEEEESNTMTHLFDNESLHECVPYTFNAEKAEALGLAREGAFTDEYFRLQAFYCEALWNWLSIEADFARVDEELEKNALNFVPRTRYQSVYQQKQSFGTKFLYLRCNIMIENLRLDEIDTLRVLCDKGSTGSEEMKAFIEETWHRVITENTDYPADATCILDMSNGRRVVNCSLLIGIDTMFEIGSDGRVADAEHEREKADFIDRLCKALGDELGEMFDVPVFVIHHD